MWKGYTAAYIRGNRAASLSIMLAALIAALFLSFLCCLFYNFWVYEIERIGAEEGMWQASLTGALDEDDLAAARAFPNVAWAEWNEAAAAPGEKRIDLAFSDRRTVYRDMPRLAASLGLEESAAAYHALLLSRYFVHDPADPEPPLLMAFYLAVLLLAAFSLVLVIRGAFAASMGARIRQFGILSSVGATPGQLRACLLQEALALCALPVLLGCVLGTGLSAAAVAATNRLAAGVAGRQEAVWTCHPLVFGAALLACAATVLLSALLSARKLGRVSPLEAIGNAEGFRLKRRGRSRLLYAIFGAEGLLAGNALKARRKALRVSAVSLTLSFLGFTMMLCFFTLSGISTRHTYFERYRDAWDVMLTARGTRLAAFEPAAALQARFGARDCVVYQRAEALCPIPAAYESAELAALGGPAALAGMEAPASGWTAPAELVVMDDAAFLDYCARVGASPRLDGAIVYNEIWDSRNSNFRARRYVPYLREDVTSLTLQNAAAPDKTAALPVLAFVRETPALREEYANYALVQFLPLSLWETLPPGVADAAPDTHVRILAGEGASRETLEALEAEAARLCGAEYTVESENRLRDEASNDAMLGGFKLLLGALCALLALIGLANVFTGTLGFLRQRRREFARYLSVGLTPSGMRKLLCIEALVIAGRPALITLPLTLAFIYFAASASHLDPAEFWAEAPLLPIGLFLLAIFGFVTLAYYLGGRQLARCDLNEALRNDATT